jgi:hypothetical protein
MKSALSGYKASRAWREDQENSLLRPSWYRPLHKKSREIEGIDIGSCGFIRRFDGIRAIVSDLQRFEFDGPRLGLVIFEEKVPASVQRRVGFMDRARSTQMITAIAVKRARSWQVL